MSVFMPLFTRPAVVRALRDCYEILGDLTPLKSNCGKLCGAACCESDETGENGHLAVLHGNEIIYVIEERAAHRPPLVSGVGVRLPSHLTATGRAILSALPRNQVRALYPNRQAFTDRTGIGPKSPKELEATLAETQRTGFAEEHGDVTPGFDSYAVAVRDYNDFPIAGLALTFVSGSLRPEQERSLKTKLRLSGTELSRRLGAVGSLT